MPDDTSALFLGYSGEQWDFFLIVSLVLAALAAICVGATTAGSVMSHKREADAAQIALDKFKLSTEEK
jgi:hypothetical protein